MIEIDNNYKYFEGNKVRIIQIVQKGTRVEISRDLNLDSNLAGFFVNIEELKDE